MINIPSDVTFDPPKHNLTWTTRLQLKNMIKKTQKMIKKDFKNPKTLSQKEENKLKNKLIQCITETQELLWIPDDKGNEHNKETLNKLETLQLKNLLEESLKQLKKIIWKKYTTNGKKENTHPH